MSSSNSGIINSPLVQFNLNAASALYKHGVNIANLALWGPSQELCAKSRGDILYNMMSLSTDLSKECLKSKKEPSLKCKILDQELKMLLEYGKNSANYVMNQCQEYPAGFLEKAGYFGAGLLGLLESGAIGEALNDMLNN